MNPRAILSSRSMLRTKKALRLASQCSPKWLFVVISIVLLFSMTACVGDIRVHVTFHSDEEWKAEIRLSFTSRQVMLVGGKKALEAQLQREVDTRLASRDIRCALKKEPQEGGGVDYILSVEGKGVQEFNQAVLSKPYMAELLAGPTSLRLSGSITEGQVLVIVLDSNLSAGYSWEVAEIDRKVLRQVGSSEFKQESGLLGAPGKQILRFEAVGTGYTTLRLIYQRPWEKGVEATREIFIEAVDVGLVDLFEHLNSTTSTSTPPLAQQGKSERALTIVRVGENPIASSDNTNTVYLPLVMKNYLALRPAYNWCDLGGCTPVKDQGACGSCWAFGTVGPLESNIKFQDGAEEDLSEQYLVSCNIDGWGCSGGWWAHDYHWNKMPPSESEAGAVLEAEFPYEGEDVACSGPYNHPYRLNSWACIGDANPPHCCTGDVLPVEDLKQAIHTRGPISVAVCVGSAFQNYEGGVFETDQSSYCGADVVNHGVVLVGWDDNQGSKGIWILRNSWGPGWGEDGHMRIGYGISNLGSCASYIVYSPSVALTTPSAGWVTIVSEGFGGTALVLGLWWVVKRSGGSGS